jgi:hypothetical protein
MDLSEIGVNNTAYQIVYERAPKQGHLITLVDLRSTNILCLDLVKIIDWTKRNHPLLLTHGNPNT